MFIYKSDFFENVDEKKNDVHIVRPNATLFPCPNSVLVHNTQWKYVCKHGRKKIRGKILFNVVLMFKER